MMKLKKTTLVLYGLLLIAIGVAVSGKFKERRLHKELNETQQNETQIIEQIDSRNDLLKIDSLLIKGKYASALKAYKQKMTVTEENVPIKLRVQIAQRFLELSELNIVQDSSSLEEELESKIVTSTVAPNEIRKYDSLSFVLAKVKAQLNRMKKKQQKKSYGEYLTFTNRKKHKVHYVGQVKNEKASGYGIAFFDTGSRYEGEWKENLRHGEGAFYWTDGQSYVGQYLNDRRNGNGTYAWPNGEKYVGQWKDDQRNGKGIFYGKNNKVITEGVWENDKLVKEDKNKK
ncbi:MORN repeat-containing protein [Aquimarina litoralis]|uniref:MORN repeat-containing protein n=1 Tax=Aquimarina litoralis TaxID=584605 RepID=UPI001C593E77|nr:hypothetical protein [Aquimarina litoralis]MBW1296447.1 hypothetical protein [Aquimarina litoralis]